MYRFLASVAAVVLNSPKAKRALRGLAVKGTVAALEVKEQITNTIQSMKNQPEIDHINTEDSQTHYTNPLTEFTTDDLYHDYNLTDSSEATQTAIPDLSNLEHTYAVLDDKAIEKYLPKDLPKA